MNSPTTISVSVKDVLQNVAWDHKAGTINTLDIIKLISKSPSYVGLVSQFNLLKIKHKQISLDLLLSTSLIQTVELGGGAMEIPHLILGILKSIGSKKYNKFKVFLKNQVKQTSAKKAKNLSKEVKYFQDLSHPKVNLVTKSIVRRLKVEDEVISIIGSKYKNSVLIVGPKDSGKTSLIISVVDRIKKGQVPPHLHNAKIIRVNLNQIVSNSANSSNTLFDLVVEIKSNFTKGAKYTIFIFDDIHLLNSYGVLSFSPPLISDLFTAVTSESDNSSLNTTTKANGNLYQSNKSGDKNKLKTYKDSKVVFIGTINEDHSERFFDSPLYEFWNPYYLRNPKKSEMENILMTKVLELESHYNASIDSKCIPLVVKAGYKLDDSSGSVIGTCVSLLDIITSKATSSYYLSRKVSDSNKKGVFNGTHIRQSKNPSIQTQPTSSKCVITPKYVIKYFKKYHDITLTNNSKLGSYVTLNTIKNDLSKQIVGQNTAIESLTSIIKRSYLGIKEPKKPICSLLFLGPTGVGKSQTAKTLASSLYDKDSLLRLDMADFAEKHTVARLVGSPPGYVGYSEGAQLIDFVKDHPRSVILFDEVEKAHSDVLNILLSILQEGEITSGDGEVVKFNKCVIILTSNLGANLLSKEQIGFLNTSFDVKNKQVESMLKTNLKKSIKPEILNRLDDIVVFNPLKKSDAKIILNNNLTYYNDLLFKKHKTKLKYDKSIVKYLLNKGYSVEYGVREIKRSIEKNLLSPVVEKIIKHHPKVKPQYSVSIKRGKLVVK